MHGLITWEVRDLDRLDRPVRQLPDERDVEDADQPAIDEVEQRRLLVLEELDPAPPAEGAGTQDG